MEEPLDHGGNVATTFHIAPSKHEKHREKRNPADYPERGRRRRRGRQLGENPGRDSAEQAPIHRFSAGPGANTRPGRIMARCTGN